MPVIETAEWRIKQSDHTRFLNLIVHGPKGDDKMGLQHQGHHPEWAHYYLTRTFCRKIPHSDEEEWFFVDEYNNLDECRASHKGYRSQAKDMAVMVKLEKELMIEGSLHGPFIWEEQAGTRIEFPGRQLK